MPDPEGIAKALREPLLKVFPAQAGVYLVSTLSARELVRQGVGPTATAGYSLGNYAAMVAAGAIYYEDALDVLVAVWRETERLGIRGAMGAVIGARREAVEDYVAGAASRGTPRLDRQRQCVHAVRADGQRRGVEGRPRGARPPRPLDPSAHHELADPQRAMRPVAEPTIAPGRSPAARDRAPARRAVLRPRGACRSPTPRTCGACSARPSASRPCGRRRSRRWSPTAIASSSKPGPARCSRG